MHPDEFNELIEKQTKPVILDVWATWCMPCRMMEPALRKVEKEYEGRVDVWRINADEAPDLVKHLGVLGVPSLLGYAGGKRVFRKTGAQDAKALHDLFEAALGNQVAPNGLRGLDRLLRAGSGAVFLGMGWLFQFDPILLVIGAVLVFSAFYDRCPVYRALAPRLAAFFKGNQAQQNDA